MSDASAAGGGPEEFPPVSFVMPALNEELHIASAIHGLLAQDYDGLVEIVVAHGPSTDGTGAVLEALAASDQRIRAVDNPTGATPAGLNLAIDASRHDIVIRVDAHSILPPDYTRVAVRTLRETGAVNVGGVMNAVGTVAFEHAVAHAYGSRLGLGGTAHHVGGTAGPAETVYLGVFRRSALLAVGKFDEDYRRGQDWELNQRLREAGGVVWFTPELSVTYRPRSSYRALRKQFYSTGVWRGEIARRYESSRSLRYFAPPVLVVGLVLGTIAGLFGAITGPAWLLLGWLPVAGYLAGVVVAALPVASAHGAKAGLWYLVVLPTIHLSWGLGFMAGFARLTKQISEYTGR